MLYISRRVGELASYQGDSFRDGYYIMDTDDGVEEYISVSGLVRAAVTFGLDIAGVAITDGHHMDAMPYQLVDTVTPLQTKLRVMYGINIVVWNDMIVGIDWVGEDLNRPVRVRLSDFATSLGDTILLNRDPIVADSPRNLVLVLDDKIVSFSAESLRSGNIEFFGFAHLTHGVVYDIRELSSDDLAKEVYKAVAWYCESKKDVIIDNPERRRRLSKQV